MSTLMIVKFIPFRAARGGSSGVRVLVLGRDLAKGPDVGVADNGSRGKPGGA